MVLTWPEEPPAYGSVVLRPFRVSDLPLIAELSSDPYLPLIGTLPAAYTEEAGLSYLARQHQRLVDETGYSFAIADSGDGRALGGAGLWLQHPEPRATLGYAVAPSARGRGVATDALHALTAFGWTVRFDPAGAEDLRQPAGRTARLEQLELYIEPWNTGSIRAAERAGYRRDALLERHRLIGGIWRDMFRYLRLRP